MDDKNRRGFGLLKTFDVGQINATLRSQITALEDEVTNEVGFVNVIYIFNEDAVEYEFFPDNDQNRKLFVPAKNNGVPGTLTLNGTRFTKLQIKNRDGAVNGTANLLHFTVMKELGDLEKRQGY